MRTRICRLRKDRTVPRRRPGGQYARFRIARRTASRPVIMLLAVTLTGAAAVSGAGPLSAPPALAQATFTVSEQPIAVGAGNQYAPAISGNIIAYDDDSAGERDVDYYDLASGKVTRITSSPGTSSFPSVSGPLIAYTVGNHVMVYSVATSTTTDLTPSATATTGNPSVGGNIVAWQDQRNGNWDIYAEDLSTGELRQITTDSASDTLPSVGDGRIAWQRCTATCDIYYYDWASKGTTQVTNTPDDENPDVSGDNIVYEGTRNGETDIYDYNIQTHLEKQLRLTGIQANPSVSGGNVTFEDSASGTSHIRLWHLATGQVFDVTSGSSSQYLNDIDGNHIVYTDDRNGNLDIFMSTFTINSGPPVIVRPADQTVDATSPAGATVSYTVTVTDPNNIPPPKADCVPASGSVFRIGTATVTCNATDSLGNKAVPVSFTITVNSASQQLTNLISQVRALHLGPVTTASLVRDLQFAQGYLTYHSRLAIRFYLHDFQAKVKALSGRLIPAPRARELIADAQRILTVIGTS
jgi:beta propeller repeat protein